MTNKRRNKLVQEMRRYLKETSFTEESIGAQFSIGSNVAKELERISKDFLDINTLKERKSDELDFHDVAVWSLADALYAAYMLGRNS